MRVVFESGDPPVKRYGRVDGYVQVEHNFPDNPNIFAIVIDDKTGTFCALPIYRLKAIQERARNDRTTCTLVR